MFAKSFLKSHWISILLLSCNYLGDRQLVKSQQFNRLLIYGLFLILGICYPTSKTLAQPQPLTPERPQPPVPQTLPPSNNPLNDGLERPPIPESVLDIPGTVVVEKFNFAGSTVFSQAALNQAIAEYTNKPISFAQLIEAANVITQLYVKEGYITSGAYLPEQNLNSSRVQIQIIEGSLAEIEVDISQGRLNENYIRDRLKNRVTTPLNIDQLQSALQLLQLNPLISSLDAELSTGIQPGTNALKVRVIGADTFALQTRLNNNRNPSIGTFERGVTLTESNLFGIGDEIELSFLNTDGSNQYEVGYTFPLNARDGTLSFDVRSAQNEIVEADFAELDIDIESRNYNLTWRQPIIQRASPEVSQELALNLTASRRESDTSILDIPEGISPGANAEGEIRTSVLSLGQEWLQRNRKQVIAASSQFNLGLDALGAEINDNEPNGQFFAWRGQVSYLRLLSLPQGIPAVGSTILLRSELQLAADPLIPTEQFSLGGASTVRGYRQDALLADNGLLATAEMRLPLLRFSKLNASLQFSPFIDFGTGWNSDDRELDLSTLLGAGVGLILQSDDQLSARIDWGFPLINNTSDDDNLQENGVYLQLQYNLF